MGAYLKKCSDCGLNIPIKAIVCPYCANNLMLKRRENMMKSIEYEEIEWKLDYLSEEELELLKMISRP